MAPAQQFESDESRDLGPGQSTQGRECSLGSAIADAEQSDGRTVASNQNRISMHEARSRLTRDDRNMIWLQNMGGD